MSQTRLGRFLLFAFTAVVTGVIPASAETLTLMWDANTEPQVMGYIVHVGSAPGSYSQHIDVGNTTQYDVITSPGERYCLSVSAYADGPLEGQTSVEVCHTGTAAPLLTSPGDQVTPVGQPVSVALSGVDPEAATLTYTVTGLPAGLTVSFTYSDSIHGR